MKEDSFSKKIQVCRAVSIIAVVCIHTCGNYGIYIRPILNFAVAAFLFISGFLIPAQIPDVKAFYKKRLLRVFVPYTIWSVIYTIYYRSFARFPYNFLTGQCCSIYYYILVIMQLTLLVPLLNKLIQSPRWKLGFIISPIAITIQYALTFFNRPINFPWNANLCFVWIVYFYFGMCVRSGKLRAEKIKYRAVIAALLIQYAEVAFWYLLIHNNAMATSQIKLSAIATSIAFICMGYKWTINSKSLNNNLATKVIVNIGDISFGIYLIHPLIIRFTETLPKIIVFPINAAIVVTIAFAFINLVVRLLGKQNSKHLGLI